MARTIIISTIAFEIAFTLLKNYKEIFNIFFVEIFVSQDVRECFFM